MGDDFDFRAMLRPRRTGHSRKIVPFGRRKSRKGKYVAGWMLVGGLLLGATAGTVGLRWTGGLLPSAPPPVASDGRDVAGTYDPAELEASQAEAQREAANARQSAKHRANNASVEADAIRPVYRSPSLGIGCVGGDHPRASK